MFPGLAPRSERQHLQSQIAANAVLQMDDVISFLQIGKIDVQCRAHRLRVRRFEATRSLKDRKSTRLNSSHSQISYAVFCLKKKKKTSYPYGSLVSPPRT